MCLHLFSQLSKFSSRSLTKQTLTLKFSTLHRSTACTSDEICATKRSRLSSQQHSHDSILVTAYHLYTSPSRHSTHKNTETRISKTCISSFCKKISEQIRQTVLFTWIRKGLYTTPTIWQFHQLLRKKWASSHGSRHRRKRSFWHQS